MGQHPNPLTVRKADHPIEPLFLKRWSPRAMSGEPITDGELKRLFEAARWAPSTRNEQEWRFLFAHKDSPHWPTFFDLLAPGNQGWCKQASVLVVVVAHKFFSNTGAPNPVHLYDAGAAWQNLALQGAAMGLVVHGMAGFDYDQARTALHVPEDFDVAAMIALGRPGDPATLPEDLRQREVPSLRRPIEQSICEGPFAF
ncbi:nitroreductase family protein [Tautonia marina]|uniref:nitroreductase family protein n=1 Tax=Tautonia marina TaxID=2653855 RepID=UPI001260699D|nr:nitroreductase family protein [Tautonia marina]